MHTRAFATARIATLAAAWMGFGSGGQSIVVLHATEYG
jgi:hypothetical protein